VSTRRMAAVPRITSMGKNVVLTGVGFEAIYKERWVEAVAELLKVIPPGLSFQPGVT
jgi:hypothetical protein